MKKIRLLAITLSFIAGCLHIFFAYNNYIILKTKYAHEMLLNTSSTPFTITVIFLYLILGIQLIKKKKFPFFVALAPFALSILNPNYLTDYFYGTVILRYIEMTAVVCCIIALLNLKRNNDTIIELRMTLRVLSVFLIAECIPNLLLMFAFAGFQALFSEFDLSLLIYFSGIIGLALTWKWELIGGIITLIVFLLKLLEAPENTFELIWPLNAILFIILWIFSKKFKENKKILN